MSLTYTTYAAQLAQLATMQTTDTKFTSMLPGCIDYAEQRMYRELDLLSLTVVDATGSVLAGARTFTLPQQFSPLEQVSYLTSAGKRVPLLPVSREALDVLWGDPNVTAAPKYFAMQTDRILQIGPWPDTAYKLECTGKVIPAPLASGNASTFLTLYLPDAFIAASMIYVSGIQKNFTAQSSNPQQGTSWEDQYGKLMASAQQVELQRKWRSVAWSAERASPTATPNREGN